ncbi:MAG TPA: cytochrome C, partial [Lamprocystis sp. (in: g-proteobacteria)]|nr:cytochrome C [Lamprocystis sp. (in: g-proteobacteria)]
MAKAMIAALGTALIALAVTGFAWSDDDDEGGKGRKHGREGWGGGRTTVTNDRYRAECGGCHLAYPPGLLSAGAWGQVMGTLDNHYGDDASLAPAVVDELQTYLQGNATDGRGRSTRVSASSIKGGEPPRITQTAYFQR